MTSLLHKSASTNRVKNRLGIVQRVLTVYRAPFFDRLAIHSGFETSIFAGQPIAGESIKTVSVSDNTQCYLAKNHYWLNSKNMIVWQSNILSWLRDFDPDVLIMEANPRILTHWLAIQWMHNRGRPVLGWGLGELARTGSRFSLMLRRLTAQALVQAYDCMISYSEKAKNDYVTAGVAPSHVVVAHNSIDNTESERYLAQLSDTKWIATWRTLNELDTHLPIVIFVGRLIADKQVDMLIQACIPLFDRCQLLIVGDGSARSDLEQNALPYKERIRFVGHQTGKVLARSFIASNIFVLPGAGGLALHQAMSYGKPVIASFCDGTEADLIQDGHNGLTFQLGDVNDLTSKIAMLLSNPKQTDFMGQASLSIVRNKINLNKMITNFVSAIEVAQVRMAHKK